MREIEILKETAQKLFMDSTDESKNFQTWFSNIDNEYSSFKQFLKKNAPRHFRKNFNELPKIACIAIRSGMITRTQEEVLDPNFLTQKTLALCHLLTKLVDDSHNGRDNSPVDLYERNICQVLATSAINTSLNGGPPKKIHKEIEKVMKVGYTIAVSYRLLRLSGKHISQYASPTSATGINPTLVAQHKNKINHLLSANETILNAGYAYVPSDGPTGDGELFLTNQRIIYLYDKDFDKDPVIIDWIWITSVEVKPTTLAPASQEICFTVETHATQGTFCALIGNTFAAEINNLLEK